MKFTIELQNETIRKAAALVMEHYKDSVFLFNLGAIQDFNHTHDSGYALGKKIFNSDLGMTIKPYKTFSPWSKVVGHSSNGIIYVNTRKLNLSLKDRVENIFHESLHALGYSHKGNSNNEYNRGTVPYRAAKIFVDYLVSIGKL